MEFAEFYIKTTSKLTEVDIDFKPGSYKDLMIRGGDFYAIWDESTGMWSKDRRTVVEVLDREGWAFYNQNKKSIPKLFYGPMNSFNSMKWSKFLRYIKGLGDSFVPLDGKVIFANQKTTMSDYSSRRLPYDLVDGPCPAYEKLVSKLYSPEERRKFEWAIGAVLAGEMEKVQKFVVFYGESGKGKSTILNLVQKLFEGYYVNFKSERLGMRSDQFAMEPFARDPLVAVDQDGNLSRLEDNTTLNTLVSHEPILMNEKHKSQYTIRSKAIIFIGSNSPVKITDAKSGLIRRLLDVHLTGETHDYKTYISLVEQCNFELGAIANHCLQVYLELGPNGYSNYRPTDMIKRTDIFYNFMEDNFETFKNAQGIGLKQAYKMWKEYETDSGLSYSLPKHKFKAEFGEYFKVYYPTIRIGADVFSNYYVGLRMDKFNRPMDVGGVEERPSLVFDRENSLLDDILALSPAQYANEDGIPKKRWADVDTTLKDVDSRQLHYVQPRDSPNHIVVDFDLKDANGKKSAKRNLEAAAEWPRTYGEFSKSGAGVHLHYIWEGETPVSDLVMEVASGIEIKRFTGNSSLRRKLTKCNGEPIATLREGIPAKEKKENDMLNERQVKTEKGLRDLIERNLRKEIHGHTTPSVDFIEKILSDAYESGMSYDVSDMKQRVLIFASRSSNRAEKCINAVGRMKFRSEEMADGDESKEDSPLVFFDIEVYPNLFLVCWKYDGDENVVSMVNPKPEEVEALLANRLVGFNNRRFDNHILYAASIGYTIGELYALTRKIISQHSNDVLFGAAYNLSYTDIYDFAAKKQSLKKWQIEMGIHHQEMGLPWDEPVPDDRVNDVIDYCVNDVVSTEALFHHLEGDWKAREILSALSGLSVNHTTNNHTTKIIFGEVRDTQQYLEYTDLSEMFPGYKFESGKSTYRDEEVGEGGYVYAEPGMYENVALLDIASMHPTSIEQLNLFGKFTQRFSDIKQARLLIKHKEFEKAKRILDGKLAPYLEDPGTAKALSNALKIAINSVYGLTSAKFKNPFRDIRNKDNIVAKRGALFMVDLKHFVQEQGFAVAHIKTDSIKIPNATPDIIQKVMEFGAKYGYIFEHEATYEKMCLVNNAVYIAKYEDGDWTATGAQFAHPYIFKTMFTKEPVLFEDLPETKEVKTAIYLDVNEESPEDEHNYQFIGKVGSFIPVVEGAGGGLLMRQNDDKYAAVTGTKGHRWLEREVLVAANKQDKIDMSYYEELLDEAEEALAKYGDVYEFCGYSKKVA